MAHHKRQQDTAQDTNGSLRMLDGDLQISPPRRTSTATSIPPDVAASRRDRINKDLLAYFQRPIPPRSSTLLDVNPTFLRGIGVYTHAEVPAPLPESLFPHQRFPPQAPQVKFLPLGGPGGVFGKTSLKSDLPEDVKALYDTVKGVVLWEGKKEGAMKTGQLDPREKFDGLALPNVTVRSPGNLEQQRYGSATADTGRRTSGSGSMKSLGGGEMRPSSPGGGSTGARIPKSAQPASTGNATTAPIPQNADTNASGTLYDASRDPRRRGR